MLQPGQRYGTEDELRLARARFGAENVRALVIVPDGAIVNGDWQFDGPDLLATADAVVRLGRQLR